MFHFKPRIIFLIALAFIFLASCKHHATVLPNRTYRMGFQNFAPKPTIDSYLQSLDLWTKHADAAIISIQVPWDSLYKGTAPDKYIINNFRSLVNYYRSKNFKLWVYIDPANGLNRAADANDL